MNWSDWTFHDTNPDMMPAGHGKTNWINFDSHRQSLNCDHWLIEYILTTCTWSGLGSAPGKLNLYGEISISDVKCPWYALEFIHVSLSMHLFFCIIFKKFTKWFCLCYYCCSIGTRILQFQCVQLFIFFRSYSFFVSFHSFYFGIPHDRRLNGCFEIDFCFLFVIFNLFFSFIFFLLWGWFFYWLKRNKTLRD